MILSLTLQYSCLHAILAAGNIFVMMRMELLVFMTDLADCFKLSNWASIFFRGEKKMMKKEKKKKKKKKK